MDYSEDNRKQKGICPVCGFIGICTDSRITLKERYTRGWDCVTERHKMYYSTFKEYEDKYECIKCGYKWTETYT